MTAVTDLTAVTELIAVTEPVAEPFVDTRPLRHWLHGADEPHLVICCVEHPHPDAWSRVLADSLVDGRAHAVVQLSTCAGQLPPAVLLELVAGGASGITLALDGCANRVAAERIATQAGTFLAALGHLEPVDTATVLPQRRKRGAAWPILDAAVVPVSRRALFGRRDGLDLAEPSRHRSERLVAVLGELAGGDGSGTELDAIPSGVPRFTASRCAGSGVCARTCPVGALTLTQIVLAEAGPDRDGMAQFQLTFDSKRCTDCGLCLSVCPESALERSGQSLWSSLLAKEPVSLRVGLIRACARCGSPHGRPGDHCAVCAYRAANPFGSTMPPGWQ